MPIFVLVLLAGLFVHDGLRSQDPGPVFAWWQCLLIAIVPRLLLGAGLAWACRRARRGLDTPTAGRRLRRLEKLTALYRLTAIGCFALDLAAGTLVLLRQGMGDWVLIDELLMLTPTLAALAWSWWCYYPIDVHIRGQGRAIRQARGLPVFPLWTRGQYLLAQFRLQVAMMLVPMMALSAYLELLNRYAADLPPALQSWAPALMLGGVAVIYLTAPAVVCSVLSTSSLPPGELRQRLAGLCTQYRVGLRDLKLWHTFGGVVNAAVMGIIAPLRYILLSDALLESMSPQQIEAVMAHEIAHVRRRHLFWLLLLAVGLFGLSMSVGDLASASAAHLLRFWPWPLPAEAAAGGQAVLRTGVGLILWGLSFGWVSRRMERQADAFAVQHLNRQLCGGADHAAICPQAAATMIDALQQVADLNHIAVARRSWRHGSIAWRQTYLASLVGQRGDRLAIDRIAGRINGAGLAILASHLAWQWYQGGSVGSLGF